MGLERLEVLPDDLDTWICFCLLVCELRLVQLFQLLGHNNKSHGDLGSLSLSEGIHSQYMPNLQHLSGLPSTCALTDVNEAALWLCKGNDELGNCLLVVL